MTTTPWATGFEYRFDAKCGRGAISPGEKCHVGQATEATPRRGRRVRRALAVGAGVAGVAAGAYLLSRRRGGSRGGNWGGSGGGGGGPKSPFRPKGPKSPSDLSPEQQEKLRKWADKKVHSTFGGSGEAVARRQHNEIKRRAAERWVNAQGTSNARPAPSRPALPPARSERGRDLGNGKRGYSWEDYFQETFEDVTRDIQRLKKRKDSPWADGFTPRRSRNDAPETGTTDARVAAEFFKALLDAVTTGHLLHLQSRSYSQHQALGSFYDELNDLADGLIESYQGKYGIVTDYPQGPSQPNGDPIAFITQLSDYVRTTRAAVASDSELQNDIDSIQSLIDSTLYKLTNLR